MKCIFLLLGGYLILGLLQWRTHSKAVSCLALLSSVPRFTLKTVSYACYPLEEIPPVIQLL